VDKHEDRVFATIIIVALAVVVVAIVVAVIMTTKDGNAAKVGIIEACVSNGGSWVMDGRTGECWQGNFGGGQVVG